MTETGYHKPQLPTTIDHKQLIGMDDYYDNTHLYRTTARNADKLMSVREGGKEGEKERKFEEGGEREGERRETERPI